MNIVTQFAEIKAVRVYRKHMTMWGPKKPTPIARVIGAEWHLCDCKMRGLGRFDETVRRMLTTKTELCSAPLVVSMDVSVS